MELVKKAEIMAREIHAGQKRRGTAEDYIAHPLAVAELVKAYCGSNEEIAAALLHDTLEDGANPRDIERAILESFGGGVLWMVRYCTNSTTGSWADRKKATVERLATAPASVKLVAACDKLHNVRCILKDYREIGEPLWGRFGRGRKGGEVLAYYRGLCDALIGTPPWFELMSTVHALAIELEKKEKKL